MVNVLGAGRAAAASFLLLGLAGPAAAALRVVATTGDGVTQAEVLRLAGGAESGSEHPIAGAIVAAASASGPLGEVDGFANVPGEGVFARVDGERVGVVRPDAAAPLSGVLAGAVDAAEASGEQFWHLPIPEDVRENLKSEVADLLSSGKTRYGGALTAAAFLREFVVDGLRWAHLDIAGPAFNEAAPHGYTPKGGTGVAVRTLVQIVRDLADSNSL